MNREQRESKRLLKQAQRTEEEARRARIAAQDKYDELVVAPEIRKAIGTCYRYRNSYSCPQNPSDYWWLYMKIVAVEDGDAVVVTFQIDQYGKMEARRQTQHWPFYAGHEPITTAEFRKHWLAFKQSVARLLNGNAKP